MLIGGLKMEKIIVNLDKVDSSSTLTSSILENLAKANDYEVTTNANNIAILKARDEFFEHYINAIKELINGLNLSVVHDYDLSVIAICNKDVAANNTVKNIVNTHSIDCIRFDVNFLKHPYHTNPFNSKLMVKEILREDPSINLYLTGCISSINEALNENYYLTLLTKMHSS